MFNRIGNVLLAQVVMLALAAATVAVVLAVFAGAAAAATPNLDQSISVNWDHSPKAFYAYGEKLSYKLSITSTSDQAQFVHVHAEAYEEPAKLFLPSGITRTYKLLPGQTLHFLFQAYAPTDAVLANHGFKMDAVIDAEGYPSLTFSADAWHDSGK